MLNNARVEKNFGKDLGKATNNSIEIARKELDREFEEFVKNIKNEDLTNVFTSAIVGELKSSVEESKTNEERAKSKSRLEKVLSKNSPISEEKLSNCEDLRITSDKRAHGIFKLDESDYVMASCDITNEHMKIYKDLKRDVNLRIELLEKIEDESNGTLSKEDKELQLDRKLKQIALQYSPINRHTVVSFHNDIENIRNIFMDYSDIRNKAYENSEQRKNGQTK